MQSQQQNISVENSSVFWLLWTWRQSPSFRGVSFSGVTGAMIVVTAVMRGPAYISPAHSTSLPVKMVAASQNPMFVMGTMTVVMNQMSWNTSVLHQRQPVLPIISSVIMGTVLN